MDVTENDNGVLVMAVTPPDLLDPIALGQEVERYIVKEKWRKIKVDLRHIDYLSSVQLGALVTMHAIAYENVAVMKFVSVCERLQHLFKLLGINILIETRQGQNLDDF